MQALLLTQEFPPRISGGIAAYYYHLCRELGADVTVLTTGSGADSGFDRAQPFRTVRLAAPMQPVRFMRATRRPLLRLPVIAAIALIQYLLFFIQTWRLLRPLPDATLIVGHLYLAPMGRLVAGGLGRPYTVILHGGELHRYWHWPPVRMAMIWAMDGADYLIVNSRHTRDQVRGRGVAPELPIHIVNPGVDTERFRAPEPVASAQAGHVLLSVARLVEWKGQDMVLQALPCIRQVLPDIRYIIAGGGPYRAALEQLADSLGVADAVEFAGFVPDEELAGLYATADVVVLPSREIRPGVPVEGFGITLMEAAVAGKPVVAGNVGGTDDAVIHGITGLLVDPLNPASIANACLTLFANPDLARTMGLRAQQRAVNEFSWPHQAAQMAEILNLEHSE